MATTTTHDESVSQTRPVAIADVMRIKNVLDVRLSPDGSGVLWVVAEADFKSSSYHFNVWQASIGGGPPRQISFGQADVMPRWFPDGTQVAFISRDQATTHLCLVSAGTRPATTRTGKCSTSAEPPPCRAGATDAVVASTNG